MTDRERWIENERLVMQAGSLALTFHRVVQGMESKGWKPRVMEVRRSRPRQLLLLARGASRTLRSKHLTGQAMDVIDARYKWAETPVEFQADLFMLALGQGLTTGVLFGLNPLEKFDLTHLAQKGLRQLLIDQLQVKKGWDSCHVEIP